MATKTKHHPITQLKTKSVITKKHEWDKAANN